MANEEILKGLKAAIIVLDDDTVFKLINQGLKEGIPPVDMLTDGLQAGLTILGDGFFKGDRFMSELMVAGQTMTDVLDMLRPEMEKGRKGAAADVMVIGSVEGDLHTIGKRIVISMFIAQGYNVHDIGEDVSAPAWVEALKKYKPVVVGASAILQGTKPYCKVIHKALTDAGLRDNVVYVVGGWGMNQAWADDLGADAFGQNAMDALDKVKALRAGELKKWKDRPKEAHGLA